MSASRAWFLAAAFGVAALLPSRAVAAPDWELLGTRRVSFAADRDVIQVGAREGRFDAIKIEVEGGDIEMYDVRVVFTDGETWSPTTRLRFRAGSWSRTIDLPGRARAIRRIEFFYRSAVRRGGATVRVFGREAQRPQPPRPSDVSWERLGSRHVSLAAERDVIPVGAREGAFTALKLEVSGGSLEMYDVRITFGDGDVWSPNTRLNFREGSWSRTLDLPGRARVIRKVEFRYRSQVRRGKATVHVYGRGAGADTPAPAGTPPRVAGWEGLGTSQTSVRADRDAITVAARGGFRRIRFVVPDADIEMSNIVVTFANGESFSPQTRLVYRGTTRAREIDLPGTVRVVRRVDFHFRSLEARPVGRVTVHAYGQR
jgi:hypothetical protein